MNFEKFKSVKSKLEKLPNVKFYSFSEDTVILRNTKNDGLYQIPCVFEENDTLTLVLSQGQLVEEGKKSNAEIVKAYQEELKSNIKSIFINYDEGIKKVRENIKNPVAIIEEEKVDKKLSYEETIDIFCESDFSPIKNINTMFKDKLIEANNDKKAFIEMLNPFNEDGTLKDHDLNYDEYKDMFVESSIEYNKFNEKVKTFCEFSEAVEKIVGDKKVAGDIVKKLNFDESDLKIEIPRTLIKVKNMYTEEEEVDINIADLSKKITTAYEESFGSGDDVKFVYNRNLGNIDNTPKFLQFSSGKYTQQDVGTLAHELEQSYYILPDLTHDDLIQLADWRNQCEYMYSTNMISDKKLDEIINSFNSRFTVDADAKFNDGEQARGFHSTEEKDMENEYGVAYDDPAEHSNEADIDAGEEFEDEADNFEAIDDDLV